jgi:hypothetical protein
MTTNTAVQHAVGARSVHIDHAAVGAVRKPAATETIIRLESEDSASLIGPDTSLARALKFPAGHPVWCIWRPAKQDHEFFDATCTVLSGA